MCYYTATLNKKGEFHAGLLNHIEKFSLITGHYYETNFKSKPNNLFGDILKMISQQPFKHSHELLHLILRSRIQNSGWDLNSIQIATMVPTNNQQMQQLFAEVSESLGIRWMDFNELFIKREIIHHYKTRMEYVNNKYFLKDNTINFLSSIENLQNILIFDDDLNLVDRI